MLRKGELRQSELRKGESCSSVHCKDRTMSSVSRIWVGCHGKDMFLRFEKSVPRNNEFQSVCRRS